MTTISPCINAERSQTKLSILAEAQNWRCCYCGIRCMGAHDAHNQPTREHVTPKRFGGRSEWMNEVLACRICNNGRGSMSAKKYLMLVQDVGRWKAFKMRQRLHRQRVRYKAQIAAGLILAGVTVSAHALDCTKSPDRTPGSFWRYRLIDDQRCWYRSESALPKSELRWATSAEPATAKEEILDAAAQALAPILVPTISYRQVARSPEPDSDNSLLVMIAAGGFALVIAGLLWPVRRRRRA